MIRGEAGNSANHSRGTDMSIFAPVIAKRFDIDYKNTSSLEEEIEHLRLGGHVIAHVASKERGAVHGLFTNSGHYTSLIPVDDEDLCILDPSYREEKFSTPERVGKLKTDRVPSYIAI